MKKRKMASLSQFLMLSFHRRSASSTQKSSQTRRSTHQMRPDHILVQYQNPPMHQNPPPLQSSPPLLSEIPMSTNHRETRKNLFKSRRKRESHQGSAQDWMEIIGRKLGVAERVHLECRIILSSPSLPRLTMR